MKSKTQWPLAIGLILVYLLGAVIEPCDGHSCAEVTHGR